MFSSCEPEEAFVAGLTLEIGLLIYSDIYIKTIHEEMDLDIYPLGSLLSLEKKRHGIHHREIGEIALKFWKFPDNIVMCQRYYYEQSTSEMPELAKICCIAEKLSALICHEKSDLEPTMQTLTSSFGLTYDTIYDVVITAMHEVDETAQTLHIEIQGENDMLALMEKANRALIEISERIRDDRYKHLSNEPPSFDTLRSYNVTQNVEVIRTLQAMAHEIKNPLTAVSGFARRLAKTLDPTSEGWRYVEIILKEAQRLEHALDEASRGLR